MHEPKLDSGSLEQPRRRVWRLNNRRRQSRRARGLEWRKRRRRGRGGRERGQLGFGRHERRRRERGFRWPRRGCGWRWRWGIGVRLADVRSKPILRESLLRWSHPGVHREARWWRVPSWHSSRLHAQQRPMRGSKLLLSNGQLHAASALLQRQSPRRLPAPSSHVQPVLCMRCASSIGSSLLRSHSDAEG
jgi:hypothetical protein